MRRISLCSGSALLIDRISGFIYGALVIYMSWTFAKRRLNQVVLVGWSGLVFDVGDLGVGN